MALIAALGATLGLAACGRKGPLDLPPGAAVPGAGNQQAGQPSAEPANAALGERNDPIGIGPDGRAIPRGQRKPLPMDVLLN